MTAIGDRVLWEKVTRGRAGTRGDSVVEKVWKDIGGTKKRSCPQRSLGGTRRKYRKG